MTIIMLELDYLIGPIMKDIYSVKRKVDVTGVSVIDNDEILEDLNSKISDLYSECYEFDSHDQPCYFNEDTLKKNKEELLILLKQLNDRLNEINDGTYIVQDNATPFLLKRK